MNLLKTPSSFRFSLAIFISVAVYAAVSPSIRIDAMERVGPDPILIQSFNSGLPTMLRSSFGTAGEFRFITPIAPNPHDQAADFDATLLPYLTVKVCKVSGTGCSLEKIFTSTTSPDRLRIENKQGSFFIANWTTGAGFDSTPTYRISVDVPGETLGSIDLPPSAYRQWGRTWPIKFIVEKDPALRVRMLAAAGYTIWDVADNLRSTLGICGEQLRELLQSMYPNAKDVQVQQVVKSVCQTVTLPATTKIADDATRNALVSFSMATGRLIFANETTLLRNLKPNDILVSKPNVAAPYGYLRKVISIQKVKGIYTLETTQASLTDTIIEGTLDAGGDLLPSDEIPEAQLSSFAALRMADASADAEYSSTKAETSGCFDTSGSTGYHFDCSVDETFDFEKGEGEFTGTGQVRVSGRVLFNAGYDVGVGVEFCARVPVPACVDRFEARLRVQQRSELHVEGTLDATLQKEIVVARKIFKPITLWIGPVPVVIFPVANIIVGARGDAHVSFSFDAWTEGSFAIGAKWADDGKGWRNVSEDLSLSGDADVDLSGEMELREYYKGSAKLLLYGVVGPTFEGSLGGRAHFKIPGNPVWSLHGRIDGELAFEVSIIDVIKLGRFDLEDFLVGEIELDRSENFAPTCAPTRGSPINVNVNAEIRLGPTSTQQGSGYFDCTDPEGDAIDYEFKSNYPATDVIFEDPNIARLGLPISAIHTITVQATDSNGKAAPPLVLTFFVINPPPEVEVTTAVGTVPVGVQYFVNTLVYDPDEGAYLDCIRESPEGDQVRVDFFVDEPNTVRKIGDGFNCSAEIIFHRTGSQRIRVVAIDYLGASGTKFIDVNVTAAPPNAPPVIDVNSISYQAVASRSFQIRAGATRYTCLAGQICPVPNGADVAGGPASYQTLYEQPFHVSLAATDADGPAPTVTWFCRDIFNAVTIATSEGGGVYSCGTFGPARAVFIGATVSDGTTTVYSEIRTYRMTPLINPN
jgi:hypothetical protein